MKASVSLLAGGSCAMASNIEASESSSVSHSVQGVWCNEYYLLHRSSLFHCHFIFAIILW